MLTLVKSTLVFLIFFLPLRFVFLNKYTFVFIVERVGWCGKLGWYEWVI